jgi:hypothetical protein
VRFDYTREEKEGERKKCRGGRCGCHKRRFAVQRNIPKSDEKSLPHTTSAKTTVHAV